MFLEINIRSFFQRLYPTHSDSRNFASPYTVMLQIPEIGAIKIHYMIDARSAVYNRTVQILD